LSESLIVVQGNAPVLQTVVRDGVTGVPSNAATVRVTVRDGTGATVSGQTWPATLAFVTGSDGIYRVQLNSGIALVAGRAYTAEFDITLNDVTSAFVYNLFVEPPGSTDTAPASSPASPAYVSPPLLQLLNEAELAYHQMAMGKGVATVKDQNGEEVTYSIGSRVALAQYIFSLKVQLGLVKAGPARVSFGERSPWLRSLLCSRWP